jgi:hypothetical protein
MKKAQTDKYWQVYDEIKKINVKDIKNLIELNKQSKESLKGINVSVSPKL